MVWLQSVIWLMLFWVGPAITLNCTRYIQLLQKSIHKYKLWLMYADFHDCVIYILGRNDCQYWWILVWFCCRWVCYQNSVTCIRYTVNWTYYWHKPFAWCLSLITFYLWLVLHFTGEIWETNNSDWCYWTWMACFGMIEHDMPIFHSVYYPYDWRLTNLTSVQTLE